MCICVSAYMPKGGLFTVAAAAEAGASHWINLGLLNMNCVTYKYTIAASFVMHLLSHQNMSRPLRISHFTHFTCSRSINLFPACTIL